MLNKPSDRPSVIPLEDFDAILKAGGTVWPVGSRTIADAWKSCSDHDFLVYTRQPIPHVFAEIGCELQVGDVHYEPSEGAFNSWRKNEVNYIATYWKPFVKEFLIANAVAQKLGLTDRKDRVTLFQAILYQNPTGHEEDFKKMDELRFGYVDVDDGIPF